jgi:hypothetical protein
MFSDVVLLILSKAYTAFNSSWSESKLAGWSMGGSEGSSYGRPDQVNIECSTNSPWPKGQGKQVKRARMARELLIAQVTEIAKCGEGWV